MSFCNEKLKEINLLAASHPFPVSLLILPMCNLILLVFLVTLGHQVVENMGGVRNILDCRISLQSNKIYVGPVGGLKEK